jgi:ribosomal 50S subunit-recycling heat shock protein
VVLKRLLLVRSRTEAKEACDVGAVHVNGARARASTAVHPGDRIRVDYAHRTVEIELLAPLEGNVSRARARELYRVIHEEREPK